jgi:hypothetical protein
MDRSDERRHSQACWEQWYWQVNAPDHELVVSLEWLPTHVEYRSWLRRPNEALLRVVDLAVPLPRVGMELRTTGLWADHSCEQPWKQWTIANECFADALDHPDELFGTPSPYAIDLEWYAICDAMIERNDDRANDELQRLASRPEERFGYRQDGVVHGVVELGGSDALTIDEWASHRWHRWRVAS